MFLLQRVLRGWRDTAGGRIMNRNVNSLQKQLRHVTACENEAQKRLFHQDRNLQESRERALHFERHAISNIEHTLVARDLLQKCTTREAGAALRRAFDTWQFTTHFRRKVKPEIESLTTTNMSMVGRKIKKMD